MPSSKRPAGLKSVVTATAKTRPVRRVTSAVDGKNEVQEWIAAVKDEHRPIVKKVDALIRKTVPGIRSAVKWRQAFYGLEEVGWMVAVSSYTNYVSITFFAGTKLKPVPPLGEHRSGRRVNLYDLRDADEAPLQSWFRQTAATKGWGTVR